MRTTCRRVFIIGMHNSKLTYQDMDVKGGVKTYQRGVRGRAMGGLSASMYFLTVSLCPAIMSA